MEKDHGSGSSTRHRPGVSHAGMQKADLVGKTGERRDRGRVRPGWRPSMRLRCEGLEVPVAGRGELVYRPGICTWRIGHHVPHTVPSSQCAEQAAAQRPLPSPPEMPLPACAWQLHSSLSGDLLFFKGRTGREWREQEKTEIAGEREICKCIPGKHTKAMIQKKLMLGSCQLHNPIFPDHLNVFPLRISHFPTGYFVVRLPCSALQWLIGARIPCLPPHPPAPQSLPGRRDHGVGLSTSQERTWKEGEHGYLSVRTGSLEITHTTKQLV